MRKKNIPVFLPPLLAFLLLCGGSTLSFAQERKISPLERKADRLFVRQKFDKAMELYEEAVNGGKTPKDGKTAKNKKSTKSEKPDKSGEKPESGKSRSRAQSKRGRGGDSEGAADSLKEAAGAAAPKADLEAAKTAKQAADEWRKAQRKAERDAKQHAKDLARERREAKQAAIKAASAAKAGTPAKARTAAKRAASGKKEAAGEAEPAVKTESAVQEGAAARKNARPAADSLAAVKRPAKRAAKRTESTRADPDLDRARLHLKIAHLYFMLRRYDRSSAHYAEAVALRPALLEVEDVCEYVDALRFQGKAREAEVVCMNSAYKNTYSHSQRYQNTLDALGMRHSILEGEGLSVGRLALNSPQSEFWVGSFAPGQLFYAKSYSEFNDPSKLVFHRTHYYALDEGGEAADSVSQKAAKYNHFFRQIPPDLQNGAVAFSPGMDKMLASVIEYDKKLTGVEMSNRKFRPFRVRLLYSEIKAKQKRFSAYKPVFPQAEKGYSYAHPYLTDEGKTLLFTSDMPGGYGGFDLYLSRWDEEKNAWGVPVNLGPEVNTAGDEIFPVCHEGKLIFASNGLPGFGGYDLFSIGFDGDVPAAGTLSHFPYPVNSVFNDYYMYPVSPQAAYFISDRDAAGKDDIYHLRFVDDWKAPEQPANFYGMGEERALQGGVLRFAESAGKARPQTVQLKQSVADGLLMTLYFDFDSAELTPESVRRLDRFVRETGAYHFSELRFDGFADEFGSDNYNYNLSNRRAERVADFLRDRGIDVNFKIQAHGRIKLSPEELKEGMQERRWSEGEIDWKQVNRRARRVEIYNKKDE